jgi:uncharacterized protein with NRDE domain
VCFILTLFHVNPHFPLVIAANRDEQRARPTVPPHWWDGEPALIAGRDEQAGGTWLGVNECGLVAAITNRRDGDRDPARPSRGNLCLGALRQGSPEMALSYVTAALANAQFNPFNLLCVDLEVGWTMTGQGILQPLSSGPHVVTNHGDMDDDSLPIIRRAQELLHEVDLETTDLGGLLAGLGNLCADQEGEAPICRVGGEYGTVSSTLIALQADGSLAAYWHAEGPPATHPYTPRLLRAPAHS